LLHCHLHSDIILYILLLCALPLCCIYFDIHCFVDSILHHLHHAPHICAPPPRTTHYWFGSRGTVCVLLVARYTPLPALPPLVRALPPRLVTCHIRLYGVATLFRWFCHRCLCYHHTFTVVGSLHYTPYRAVHALTPAVVAYTLHATRYTFLYLSQLLVCVRRDPRHCCALRAHAFARCHSHAVSCIWTATHLHGCCRFCLMRRAAPRFPLRTHASLRCTFALRFFGSSYAFAHATTIFVYVYDIYLLLRSFYICDIVIHLLHAFTLYVVPLLLHIYTTFTTTTFLYSFTYTLRSFSHTPHTLTRSTSCVWLFIHCTFCILILRIIPLLHFVHFLLWFCVGC